MVGASAKRPCWRDHWRTRHPRRGKMPFLQGFLRNGTRLPKPRAHVRFMPGAFRLGSRSRIKPQIGHFAETPAPAPVYNFAKDRPRNRARRARGTPSQGRPTPSGILTVNQAVRITQNWPGWVETLFALALTPRVPDGASVGSRHRPESWLQVSPARSSPLTCHTRQRRRQLLWLAGGAVWID